MMSSLIAAALAAGSLQTSAPPAAAAPTPITRGAPYVVPRTDVRTMRSKMGDEYRIFIYWPDAPPPPGGYPILYMLDGNDAFPIATSITDNWGTYLDLQPGIIVGIGYPGETRRTYDYTPVTPPGTEMLRPVDRSGGADALLDFIANEVRPAIEADFPIDKTRQTFTGYSLGGLMVVYTLFNRPEMFQTYVADSPSIWFGESQVLKREGGLAAKLAKLPFKPRLFLSVGEYEQDPPAPPGGGDEKWHAFATLSKRARMVDNARELSDRLAGTPGITVQFKIHPGETHATSDFPAIREELYRAFKDKP